MQDKYYELTIKLDDSFVEVIADYILNIYLNDKKQAIHSQLSNRTLTGFCFKSKKDLR